MHYVIPFNFIQHDLFTENIQNDYFHMAKHLCD